MIYMSSSNFTIAELICITFTDTGKTKVEAFITFSTDSAERALALGEWCCHGCWLKILSSSSLVSNIECSSYCLLMLLWFCESKNLSKSTESCAIFFSRNIISGVLIKKFGTFVGVGDF